MAHACWLSMIFMSAALVALGVAAGAEPLEMVFIPAGECDLGTSDDEIAKLAAQYNVHPGLFVGESPRRRVAVKSFLIDRYPVTNAQYKAFIAATGHNAPYTWPGGKYPDGHDDHPVTGVLPADATAYAKWAGKRLPTADEWEKAARGTDGRVYPWGNDWRGDACWTDDTSCPQSLPRTVPVGAFPAAASPYGAMDMCANVAEWTATEASPADPAHNWRWYVIKGAGGAFRARYNFRCAARALSAHESRGHDWLGFRCAMDADAAPPNLATPRPTPKLPPPPTAPGPDLSAFGKPVKIGTHGPYGYLSLHPPFLPEGFFGLSMPEQLGAQGLDLAWGLPHDPFQWETNEAATFARYRCVWPAKAEMTVTLQSSADCVDVTIALKNLTDKAFTNLWSNVCFNVHTSPYFADMERLRTMIFTDDGPVSLNRLPAGGPGEPMHCGWNIAAPNDPAHVADARARYPIIFTTSRDGQFTIAQAYARGSSVASNAHYSCLHTRPIWDDVPPGEERSVKGKLYFVRGGPDDLLARWRRDFSQ